MIRQILTKEINIPLYVYCLLQMLTTFIAIQVVLSGYFQFIDQPSTQPEVIYIRVPQNTGDKPAPKPAIVNTKQAHKKQK